MAKFFGRRDNDDDEPRPDEEEGGRSGWLSPRRRGGGSSDDEGDDGFDFIRDRARGARRPGARDDAPDDDDKGGRFRLRGRGGDDEPRARPTGTRPPSRSPRPSRPGQGSRASDDKRPSKPRRWLPGRRDDDDEDAKPGGAPPARRPFTPDRPRPASFRERDSQRSPGGGPFGSDRPQPIGADDADRGGRPGSGADPFRRSRPPTSFDRDRDPARGGTPSWRRDRDDDGPPDRARPGSQSGRWSPSRPGDRPGSASRPSYYGGRRDEEADKDKDKDDKGGGKRRSRPGFLRRGSKDRAGDGGDKPARPSGSARPGTGLGASALSPEAEARLRQRKAEAGDIRRRKDEALGARGSSRRPPAGRPPAGGTPSRRPPGRTFPDRGSGDRDDPLARRRAAQSAAAAGAAAAGSPPRSKSRRSKRRQPDAKKSEGKSGGGLLGRWGRSKSKADAPARPQRKKSRRQPPKPAQPRRPSRTSKKGSSRAAGRSRSRARPAPAPLPDSKEKSALSVHQGLDFDRRIDLIGVALFGFALVAFFAVLPSITMGALPQPESGLTGSIDHALSQLFGWGKLVVPLAAGAIGLWLMVQSFDETGIELDYFRVIGGIMLFACALTWIHMLELVNDPAETVEAFRPISRDLALESGRGGGWFGHQIYLFLLGQLLDWGTVSVLMAWLVMSLMLTFDLSVVELWGYVLVLLGWVGIGRESRRAKRAAQKVAEAEDIAVARPGETPVPSRQMPLEAAAAGAAAVAGAATRPDPARPPVRPQTPPPSPPQAPAVSRAKAGAEDAGDAPGEGERQPARRRMPHFRRDKTMPDVAAAGAAAASVTAEKSAGDDQASDEKPRRGVLGRFRRKSRAKSKDGDQRAGEKAADKPGADEKETPGIPVPPARPKPASDAAPASAEDDKSAEATDDGEAKRRRILPGLGRRGSSDAADEEPASTDQPAESAEADARPRPASPAADLARGAALGAAAGAAKRDATRGDGPERPPDSPFRAPGSLPRDAERAPQRTPRSGPLRDPLAEDETPPDAPDAGPAADRPRPGRPVMPGRPGHEPATPGDSVGDLRDDALTDAIRRRRERMAAAQEAVRSSKPGSESETESAEDADARRKAALSDAVRRRRESREAQARPDAPAPAATPGAPAQPAPADEATDEDDDPRQAALAEAIRRRRERMAAARAAMSSAPDDQPAEGQPDRADRAPGTPRRPDKPGSTPGNPARPGESAEAAAEVAPESGTAMPTDPPARPRGVAGRRFLPGQRSPDGEQKPGDSGSPEEKTAPAPSASDEATRRDASLPPGALEDEDATGPVPSPAAKPATPQVAAAVPRPAPPKPAGEQPPPKPAPQVARPARPAPEDGADRPRPQPPADRPTPGRGARGPAVATGSGTAQPEKRAAAPAPATAKYEVPDFRQLLRRGDDRRINDEILLDKARVIEDTLASFGAPGKVVEVNPGPVITQFGVEPDYLVARSGKKTRVKVGSIARLDADLALALAAKTIRIEAPVPGKGFVGIEVPNDEVALVGLHDIMESPEFRRIDSKLRIALGLAVDGSPVTADLTAMPHLLIAGTTGSGKSVCVNSVISCLLLQNTPEDVQFIMVDPKRVELTGYNGIPHLVAPVVVDLERIVGVLQWVQREMEERYRKFASISARNILDYNNKIDPGTPRMPYYVVVVDELADLMMLAPDETERLLARLAQMARATGIHLIISTQRPSVDIITGLIKANFPARIAFAVASSVDSRVILDQPGAEKLLGRGDMLYQSPDAAAPLRMQGVFVSDEEINAITAYWKGLRIERADAAGARGALASPHREPVFSPSAPEAPAPRRRSSSRPAQQTFWDENGQSAGESGSSNGDRDELYDEAVALVQRLKKASISLLQRRLRIGYTRAARLIDMMEAEGIVGPAESGSKPREVLKFTREGGD